MASNEVRKDYLLNRWVVIAKERKKRPTDFIKKETTEKKSFSFCHDNEHMTPPSYFGFHAVLSEDAKTLLSLASGSFPSTGNMGWLRKKPRNVH
jgi:galactose-1-phosphate uridylyltransferase